MHDHGMEKDSFFLLCSRFVVSLLNLLYPPMAKTRLYILFWCLCIVPVSLLAQQWQYVDPRIGSVGVGRTFPGPSMPFGMVKPGPDCGVKPNAGWAPMPEPVTGFSQTHVSGTGGGQKYGNILIQPSLDGTQEQTRTTEEISLGYYATTYSSGITTEITTSERCAFYRFHYPRNGMLIVDASHYLGKSDVPDLREAQQLVGAEIERADGNQIRGYTTVRGGWNNGDAYTVFFCLVADKPFAMQLSDSRQQATLHFTDTLVEVRVGISFVSTMQAARNARDVSDNTFELQLGELRVAWQQLLGRIVLNNATTAQQRMFYTALYHTMLMPVDRSGENPKWNDLPYYDDYYAIWDTYRTSSPLLTLIAPQRQRDIIRSMLNIYRREGYMPEARSGNCNGRTQGGSNAEVVIADACVKGLEGIDYELALQAMLKDATVPPGGNEEKEGRGGLTEYNTLGYIPYGIDRAGTRTIEYAYDDYCIAEVAQRLGYDDVAATYRQKAANWKNLWRADYEFEGMKGFIMPKDREGQWLDSVPWGHSKVFHPRILYTPTTKVAPWYLPWWSTFFYEATSEEYSLSIPHDVPGLIEACGGEEAFRERLDLFFQEGYYNVANEPSFLTPCLYHWIGRPDLSTQRVHRIIDTWYTDMPDGLPGNDDSGAMSSWLAFHMMGLYPNAGQDYYLVNLPVLGNGYTMTLPNGNTLEVVVKGKVNLYDYTYDYATFNGVRLDDARITHSQFMQGGKLVFHSKKVKPLPYHAPPIHRCGEEKRISELLYQGNVSYTLNRQFRTWPISMWWGKDNDILYVTCKETHYIIPCEVVEHGSCFAWESPQTDDVTHRVQGTFCFISRKALDDLLRDGWFVYDNITWRRVSQTEREITVRADLDRTLMTISLTHPLPLVMEMKGNPLGIDWKITDNE